MKNIFILAFADVRKNKGQAVSLLIFVLIAAMFMNIGLVLLFGMGRVFDERAEKNNAPHFIAIYSSQSESIDEGLRFLENYPGVLITETLDVAGGGGDVALGETSVAGFLILSPVFEKQLMDAPSLVGEYRGLTGDAIYMPRFMALSGGLKLGDKVRMMFAGEEYVFTFAGSTEEMTFGTQFNTLYRFYISDEKLAEILERFPQNATTLLSAGLDNGENDIFLQADYNKTVSTEGFYWALSLGDIKAGRTGIPMIAAVVATVFAAILLAISLIVIRFRINTSIEENMRGIGAQKAIGFRSRQIILAIAAQFTGVAIVGGIFGIALAYAAIPFIMGILEPMIALLWKPGFDLAAIAASLLSVLVVVSLISFFSARKISKLQPLIALRGGISTHSFKKNPLPLNRTRGPLGFVLAVKQLLHRKGQAFAISIIIAAVTMASVAGITVNYNMSDGGDGFARAVFGEMPDVYFQLRNSDEGSGFKERLLERPEVRKVFGCDYNATLLVEETFVSPMVVEDCSLLEGGMLISGRYPRHDNEIALGPAIMTVAGKGIGDSVTVRIGENEKGYIVTGMVQYMGNGGFTGMITGGGMREVNPDYEFKDFNVYLHDGSDVNEFIGSVRALEGDAFENVMELLKNLRATMDGMSGIFAAVAAGVLAATVFVIIIVLYMVIKTTILGRRRDFGIQKAIGFTTFQLMNQIALNMTPVILLGVIVGSFAGFFGFNPMMALTMAGMGIVKVDMPVPVGHVAVTGLALLALAYFVSMLIALRIRKISAYALVTE